MRRNLVKNVLHLGFFRDRADVEKCLKVISVGCDLQLCLKSAHGRILKKHHGQRAQVAVMQRIINLALLKTIRKTGIVVRDSLTQDVKVHQMFFDMYAMVAPTSSVNNEGVIQFLVGKALFVSTIISNG